jgi:hypothetical protein
MKVRSFHRRAHDRNRPPDQHCRNKQKQRRQLPNNLDRNSKRIGLSFGNQAKAMQNLHDLARGSPRTRPLGRQAPLA